MYEAETLLVGIPTIVAYRIYCYSRSTYNYLHNVHARMLLNFVAHFDLTLLFELFCRQRANDDDVRSAVRLGYLK